MYRPRPALRSTAQVFRPTGRTVADIDSARGSQPRRLEALSTTTRTPSTEQLTEATAESSEDHSSGAGWRLLFASMAEERKFLAIGMVISIGWSLGRVAMPLLVQAGIDRGIDQGGSLAMWSLLVMGAGLFSAVCFGGRRYLAFRNARLIESRLRERLFSHIQRLHFSFHDVNATGDLMSRANTDLQNFQDVITMIPITAGQFVLVAATVVIMVSSQPVLAVLTLASLPLVNVLGRRFAQHLHPALRGIQQESAQLATVVEETVAGIRVVKGFGAEPVRADALAVEAEDLRRESHRASVVRSRFLPAMEIAPNVGLIAVLAYGGNLVIDGKMTIGELIGFNIYVFMLVQPLRMLGMTVANSQRAAAAGQRISGLLAVSPRITAPERPTALPPDGERGRVEFRGVSFSYGPNVEPVIKDLNLMIEPGESVALVGSTGSGKTTAASLLPRFYDVTSGAVLLDGVDVRQLDPAELRRSVGIVFEETFLFQDTVHENIAFADPNASAEAVQNAATLAGADEFIQNLPAGYDTVVGERGLSLSGGQRQRMAIARAILADPRVLILDDATSAVDPSKEHEIRDALGVAMASRTTFVIAHRPATIALADRVVLLDGGSAIAQGTHADLLANNARYRQVLAAGAESEGD